MTLARPLLIDGTWRAPSGSRAGAVFDPGTGAQIGSLPFAEGDDMDAALAAADKGFREWRKVPAYERYRLLRAAADLVRERAPEIADAITLEQGKPAAEANMEASGAADHIDWYAEEARRAYGRIIPSRAPNVAQWVIREPVGPVAAFTPWNFPVGQLVRKIAGALAAGCSIVVKPPEETPTSCILLAQAFVDAGIPSGVLNVLFGVPDEVSSRLLASDTIRKLSFTGSVPVGRRLAALAGQGLKRVTLELGGHAPFIVMDDADVELAARMAAGLKFRNAGQICASPTRFWVQAGAYDTFLDAFATASDSLRVGPGAAADTMMGPLANRRRVEAMKAFVSDALLSGGEAVVGGTAVDGDGFFFPPTIIANPAPSSRLMNDEPFGPIAAISRFDTLEEAIDRANALPFGLAAFAFARSGSVCHRIAHEVEAGMISINGFGLAAPETPFGGIKDSGYGSEGGSEGLDAYLSTKFVSQTH